MTGIKKITWVQCSEYDETDEFSEVINELEDNLAFTQAMYRGVSEDEYNIYLTCADDGSGGDHTNGGKPLKTYEEWLNS